MIARIALILGVFVGLARAQTIDVAAAISLQDALLEIGRKYESATGETVRFTFGSSGQLAAQVKAGAPIDLFVSAAAKQVDDAIAAGAATKATRVVIAGNAVALIAPPGDRSKPVSFEQLADADLGRIAVGDPSTVPAGAYAKQALDHLQIWPKLRRRLVYCTNVRLVLELVIRGDVRAGLVYQTDALSAGDKVRVVATADATWHDPIEYVAVATPRASPAAAAFLRHLAGEEAQATLRRFGFTEPPRRP